jgi:hypothetical protein
MLEQERARVSSDLDCLNSFLKNPVARRVVASAAKEVAEKVVGGEKAHLGC